MEILYLSWRKKLQIVLHNVAWQFSDRKCKLDIPHSQPPADFNVKTTWSEVRIHRRVEKCTFANIENEWEYFFKIPFCPNKNVDSEAKL